MLWSERQELRFFLNRTMKKRSRLSRISNLYIQILYLCHVSFIQIRYIPCKKYDMDSLGNSTSFHTTNLWEFGPNSHQIPWPFHVIYPRYILFSTLKHDMDLGSWKSSSHGISMAFAKKMMGFPVRIWPHFRTKPNCRQYGMRKSLSHFLQGML